MIVSPEKRVGYNVLYSLVGASGQLGQAVQKVPAMGSKNMSQRHLLAAIRHQVPTFVIKNSKWLV